METWVHVGWVLIRNGDTGVCLLEILVSACWVLTSNGDIGVRLLGGDQQWKHGFVLVCC